MGLPSIEIAFRTKASEAIRRGNRGTVCVMIKEANIRNVYRITEESKIPEALTTTNKAYVAQAFLGGVNPIKGVVIIATDTVANGLASAEVETWDYLVIPHDAVSEEVTQAASFIKTLRDNKKIKRKAVLPHVAADHEGVINFTTDDIKVEEATYTAAQYCSRIAGLIAGTPLQESVTYKVLAEVEDVPKFEKSELDARINNGEFIIFHDGSKVKVARGVNSLVTLGETKSEDMKAIKIVDTMDLMTSDIKSTAEDNYIGKYANNYNNKCKLIVAIQTYFEILEKDNLLDKGFYVGIDIKAQIDYLKSKDVYVEDMTEQQIKEANTGTNVFLEANAKIVNAIEDIGLEIFM